MSEVQGADLVDAITEWVDRVDEDLDEHDIEAILRIQLAIDASRWSGVDIAELTQGDVASLKHSLSEVDAPEFTAWVIDETLRGADIVPPRGPARKAPSSRRRTQPKKKKSTGKQRDQEQADGVSDDGSAVAEDDSDADDRATEDRETDEPGGDAPADEIGLGTEEPDLEEADLDDPDLDDPEAEASDLEDPDLEDPDLEDPEAETSDEDDFFDAGDDADTLDAAEARADDSDDAGDEDTAPDEDADEEDAPEDDEAEESVTLGGAFGAAISAPAGSAFAAATDADDLLVDQPTADLDDPDRSAGFFAELERNTTTSVTGPAPIELRDSPDTLGPSFLPPSESTEGRGRRIGLFALAAVAIVAFILAGVQLVNSVNEPDEDEVAVDAEASGADADDAEQDEGGDSPDNGDEPPEENDDDVDVTDNGGDEPEAGDEDEDDELTPEEAAAQLLATPEPTPEPDLPPAEKTAIVLTEDGDIWSIDLFADSFGQPSLVHDSDEHGEATDVTLVSAGLGVVDEDGDAFIASRADLDERVRVWRSDRMGEARTIVEGTGQYAVLDTAGSVSLFDANRAATRLSIDTVWDATAGGTPPARDIDNYIDLVAFAVGDGDVQLVQTSADDNPVFQIWDGENQPRAFNVDINERGLFMGVGAGAVARYQWFEDGPPLSAIWDPLAGTRLPAIGYATLEESTAVVLENGSVAAIDASGSGPILWDAEVSDLRAVSITTLDDEVLLLLDGGTVLRVAGDGETQNRGSIWDVTDESTSPAVKVLITNP